MTFVYYYEGEPVTNPSEHTSKCRSCKLMVLPLGGFYVDKMNQTVLIYRCPECDDRNWRMVIDGKVFGIFQGDSK